MDQPPRHQGVAAVLSFIFNGLGQLYNGELSKGLAIIFFSVIAMLILIFGAILITFWLLAKNLFPSQIALGIALFLLGLALICILGIYSIFDAYRTALKK